MEAQKVAREGSGGSKKNVPKIQRMFAAGRASARWRVTGRSEAADRSIGAGAAERGAGLFHAGAGRAGVRISPLLVEPEGSTLCSSDVKGFWDYPTLAGK